MEGTYEYELERAELLGIEPPSKEQWEENEKVRREAEIEEQQKEIAQETEAVEETIKTSHGKMDELNSILSATQVKINKFKSVCGGFTSLLKIRSGSPAPPQDRKSSTENVPTTSINDALEDLDKMKETQLQSDVEFAKKEMEDVTKKAAKKFDALDSLLAKAEKAELSMQHQNKQMKDVLRK